MDRNYDNFKTYKVLVLDRHAGTAMCNAAMYRELGCQVEDILSVSKSDHYMPEWYVGFGNITSKEFLKSKKFILDRLLKPISYSIKRNNLRETYPYDIAVCSFWLCI